MGIWSGPLRCSPSTSPSTLRNLLPDDEVLVREREIYIYIKTKPQPGILAAVGACVHEREREREMQIGSSRDGELEYTWESLGQREKVKY